MNLNQCFLPQDVLEARKHIKCYEECKEVADVHLKHGNYEMAKHRLTDALRSLQELIVLAKKKEKVLDRHNEIVQKMVQAGVQIQVFRSMHHDSKAE